MIRLTFPGGRWPPLDLPDEAPLAVHLTATRSPVLFGCRTGLCGTCLVRVRGGDAVPPTADEIEILDIYADAEPGVRLACQIRLRADAELAPYDGRQG
ncbi:MAG TPA: 2Fe-2S iron-sulfur cluster-binding protein [Myxococcota bacterium]|nr:2Fe-2S iron-sulfur cluster-binding protein [Myxococcota bacterium]